MTECNIIFVSKVYGGHEIMTIEHIKSKRAFQGDICCYVPKDNLKLCEVLQENNIKYVIHDITQKKIEILHAYFNLPRIIKIHLLLKKIFSEKNRTILVQGDIELGACFIIVAFFNKYKITSYIPYTHSFKVMRSPLWLIKDFLAYFVYKMCDEYITISNSFSTSLIKKNTSATVTVLENFIKIDESLKVRGIDYSFISNPDKFVIIIPGRVSFRQKGHDIVMELFLKYGYEFPIIELRIIGDGPDIFRLKKMSEKLPNNITCVFFGWVDNIWENASDADLIVIPSRFEGVPLVMLEAIYRNIPVITSEQDGTKDYLDKKFMFDRDNPVLGLKNTLQKFIMKY